MSETKSRPFCPSLPHFLGPAFCLEGIERFCDSNPHPDQVISGPCGDWTDVSGVEVGLHRRCQTTLFGATSGTRPYLVQLVVPHMFEGGGPMHE